jgi:hypothetical protein
MNEEEANEAFANFTFTLLKYQNMYKEKLTVVKNKRELEIEIYPILIEFRKVFFSVVTLKDLIKCPLGRTLFGEFLTKELTLENLEGYLEFERFLESYFVEGIYLI